MAEDDLEVLVRRAAQGDREAQDALVARVERPVRDAIHRRLRPALRRRVDTDDLFQMTMASAVADLGTVEWRGEPAFVGWLVEIAECRTRDAVRRNVAARRDLRRDARLTAAQGVPGSVTSPTQAAVREETAGALRAAVGRLPPEERRVVELRSVEGLSFTEIAARAGLADKHAARRLYLAAVRRLSELALEP